MSSTVRAAAAVFAAILLVTGCSTGRAAHVATAMTAHILCSQTFVAGKDPQRVFDHYVARAPGLVNVAGMLGYSINREAKAVEVTLAGGFRERAGFAPGRGCTVGAAQAPLAPLAFSFADDPLRAPLGMVAPQDPRIAAALEAAFAEPANGPAQNVAAIVIVHDGQIIAERYADGFGTETPLHSWSAAKSVTHALIGVLVRNQRLDVNRPAPVPAWFAPDDPRASVTPEMLLRQVSGQPFGDENSGFDRASQMLFLARDTSGEAEAAMFTPHGARWSYSDANYQILSGILRREIGGPDALRNFAAREIFAPLGMHTATIEFDGAGSPMGAAFIWASARDWSRFGWLYANDGVVDQGRILPEGWSEHARTPTPGAALGYGAGFWTNLGDSAGAERRRAWGAPDGSYFANGNFGQTILIAPREKLVIARFGFSLETGGVNLERTMRLAAQVKAALNAPDVSTR
jgi:CubicO group peptidase (beta-lactamase class C family)